MNKAFAVLLAAVAVVGSLFGTGCAHEKTTTTTTDSAVVVRHDQKNY